MKTTLITDITISNICDGFNYNVQEEKGLTGMNGQIIIQPEYQRNYIYEKDKKDKPLIESILKGYPIGLIYFAKREDGRYEILDGQQRITSIGRFYQDRFTVHDKYFSGLSEDEKEIFLNTKLTIYICEGSESEIKEWFEIINIKGEPLNHQELLNAINSGTFVTLAKREFSNSKNAKISKWKYFVDCKQIHRQRVFECALKWVSKEWNKTDKDKDKDKDEDVVAKYMSAHRHDDNIQEIKLYFESVIDWASSIFLDLSEKTMQGINWGRLYELYHDKPYNQKEISNKVKSLMEDGAVENKSGIYEYVLGECKDTTLLNIRLFTESIKNTVYARQTNYAKEHGISNCPLCAESNTINKTRIWEQKEMDADHVSAWINGGKTDIDNCQMLCKTHNRAKGNR